MLAGQRPPALTSPTKACARAPSGASAASATTSSTPCSPRATHHLERPLGAIVRFALATSMRRGEILRMRRADVDEAERIVLIRNRKHPTDRDRVDESPLMPAHPLWPRWDALEIINAQPKGDLFFPYQGDTVATAAGRPQRAKPRSRAAHVAEADRLLQREDALRVLADMRHPGGRAHLRLPSRFLSSSNSPGRARARDAGNDDTVRFIIATMVLITRRYNNERDLPRPSACSGRSSATSSGEEEETEKPNARETNGNAGPGPSPTSPAPLAKFPEQCVAETIVRPQQREVSIHGFRITRLNRGCRVPGCHVVRYWPAARAGDANRTALSHVAGVSQDLDGADRSRSRPLGHEVHLISRSLQLCSVRRRSHQT